MELKSPPSLYSLATGVLSSQFFGQANSQLRKLLPTPILLDVFLKRASSISMNVRMSLNEDLSCLSTFIKLLKHKEINRKSVHRLCKAVSNVGIGVTNHFSERLGAAFENAISEGNSELIEDGVLLGEFLHEAGFKASATVLKLCLDYCEKADPTATAPCVKDHQRYKTLVALLYSQVRFSMQEEAQSTREQALEFIEKWKLSEGIHLAELYSALSSLSTLEGDFKKSYELISAASELVRTFQDHYELGSRGTIEIMSGFAISSINIGLPGKDKFVTFLDFTKGLCGARSPKYADVLTVSYQNFMALGDQEQAGDVARECLEIRLEVFGPSNVLTEAAKINWMEASFGPYRRWMVNRLRTWLESGNLQCE